jgi:hypothetical protein
MYIGLLNINVARLVGYVINTMVKSIGKLNQ